jgi:hypothetical protein
VLADGGQLLEVVDRLIVSGELVVGPGTEPEHRLRRRQRPSPRRTPKRPRAGAARSGRDVARAEYKSALRSSAALPALRRDALQLDLQQSQLANEVPCHFSVQRKSPTVMRWENRRESSNTYGDGLDGTVGVAKASHLSLYRRLPRRGLPSCARAHREIKSS